MSINIAVGKPDDAFEKMQNVENFTIDDKCSQCGACCSANIAISDAEIETVKKYIAEKHIGPSSHSKKKNIADMLCPFLNTNNKTKAKCMIYEKRFEICRLYSCSKDAIDAAKEITSDAETRNAITEIKPRNIGQIFYPNKYLPKPGDKVITNTLYPPDMPGPERGTVFVIECEIKNPENKDPNTHYMKMHPTNNPKKSYVFNIAAFTKII